MQKGSPTNILSCKLFLSKLNKKGLPIPYSTLLIDFSTSAILVYSLEGRSSISSNTASVSSTSALDILSLAYCFKLSFDLGKSIPDKTFAIVAAEIEEDLTAVLPPLLLGCSDASTSFAVLTSLPLFNSPNAIATSAESLYVRSGRDFIRSKSS